MKIYVIVSVNVNAKGDNNSNKRLTLASCVLNSPERVDLETKLNGNITDLLDIINQINDRRLHGKVVSINYFEVSVICKEQEEG
jgi:sensor domain CHASE-containing protein